MASQAGAVTPAGSHQRSSGEKNSSSPLCGRGLFVSLLTHSVCYTTHRSTLAHEPRASHPPFWSPVPRWPLRQVLSHHVGRLPPVVSGGVASEAPRCMAFSMDEVARSRVWYRAHQSNSIRFHPRAVACERSPRLMASEMLACEVTRSQCGS